jgi:RNA polymerase sigma-70 factor (ECF subfamily)
MVLEAIQAPDEHPPDELLELIRDLSLVKGISPASRAVLGLHFAEGLSLSDVAAILEIPLGTVKSRLSYGLAAIRKEIQRQRRS